MRVFYKNGKAREVLELHDREMSPTKIAETLGVTRQCVYKALRRHGRQLRPPKARQMVISAVSHEEMTWLKNEAKATGVDWQDLARAMLTDAIEEARNGND